MDVNERLIAVRHAMGESGLDALLVPRADEYLGEYIPAHNERLHWLTGFTGSAGMAVVMPESAALFVDGRYTVQVRGQVDAAHFAIQHLIKQPPVRWLCKTLQKGARVGADPRCHTWGFWQQARADLEAAGIELVPLAENLIDRCWQDRPAPAVAEAMLLDEAIAGESSASKRERLGSELKDRGIDAALVFAPDSVSWLCNVRGRDIPQLPVLQASALLWGDGRCTVMVDPARLPADFASHAGAGVDSAAESEMDAVFSACAGRRVLVDPATANAAQALALQAAGAELVEGQDPAIEPKACKNSVEIEGAREAHRLDGVAVVRFLAWLDAEVAAGRLHNEAELADQLLEFRKLGGQAFHEPSFDTISAAGPNAAMCHYNHRNVPAPASLTMNSVYLVDSGGQYTGGTTDITRTVAIGDPGDEVRRLFTLVLKGHIALDTAIFPPETTGTHLDVLARQFLWREGRDYDHGTGHGVGAFLSVHEGPQRIARAWNSAELKPGMIVSNEPGYYRDDAFGIRCENLVLVREVELAAGEQPMLGFEALTLAPFDRRLILTELLSAGEVAWIDAYHAQVRAALQEQLDGEVREWLLQATQPLLPALAEAG